MNSETFKKMNHMSRGDSAIIAITLIAIFKATSCFMLER